MFDIYPKAQGSLCLLIPDLTAKAKVATADFAQGILRLRNDIGAPPPEPVLSGLNVDQGPTSFNNSHHYRQEGEWRSSPFTILILTSLLLVTFLP